MQEQIGFIGLGTMGGTIAQVLLRRHKLQVFDLRADRVAALAGYGAQPAQNAAELAEACTTVVTCLPRSEDVEALCFGAGGMAAAMHDGATLIDMTTGDPALSRSIAQRLQPRCSFVDASLAGGIDGALAGTLSIFVGAEPGAFRAVLPLLNAVTPKVFHAGPVGNGNLMKLVNNVIGSTIRAVTCEAVVMAAANGLDLATIARILPQSSARSHFAETALPRYLKGEYRTNFAAELMVKDLRIASRIGSETHTPMPVAALMCGIYQAMVEERGAGTDVDVLLDVIEAQAGTRAGGVAAAAS